MNGWSPYDYALKDTQSVGANQSNSVLTKEFPIYSGGAVQGLVVKIKVTAATVAAGITAKFQTAIGNDWEDSKTVAVTTADDYYIKFLATAAGDQTYMPLLCKGRVVVTTGAGDSLTVTQVQVLQEL